MRYERRAFAKLQTPAITPSIPSGLTTLPSCLQQDTSPYTGEAKLRRLLPPRARPCGRAASPLYIGLPQRFCEAKDLWEEEERASKPCPDERGAAKFALLRRGGKGREFTPSVTTPKQASDVVTAPRRGAYNKEFYRSRMHLLAPQEGAYNKEFYRLRKHLLILREGG